MIIYVYYDIYIYSSVRKSISYIESSPVLCGLLQIQLAQKSAQLIECGFIEVQNAHPEILNRIYVLRSHNKTITQYISHTIKQMKCICLKNNNNFTHSPNNFPRCPNVLFSIS